MLRLVHPPQGGNGPPAPARRKGRPSPALFLTLEEARAVRAAARNIARTYGGLAKLAAALGVGRSVFTKRSRPHPGLAIALARVANVSVDSVLGRAGLTSLPGGAS